MKGEQRRNAVGGVHCQHECETGRLTGGAHALPGVRGGGGGEGRRLAVHPRASIRRGLFIGGDDDGEAFVAGRRRRGGVVRGWGGGTVDDGPRTFGGVTPGSALEADDATRREESDPGGLGEASGDAAHARGADPSRARWRVGRLGEKRAGGGVESTERAGPLGDESGRAPLFDERAEGGVVGAEKLRAVVPLEIGGVPAAGGGASAGTAAGLVHGHVATCLSEARCGGQAGDAAADDGDARARGSGEGGGHRNRAAAVSGRAGAGSRALGRGAGRAEDPGKGGSRRERTCEGAGGDAGEDATRGEHHAGRARARCEEPHEPPRRRRLLPSSGSSRWRHHFSESTTT